jgi:class 3 adenylate cyclase
VREEDLARSRLKRCRGHQRDGHRLFHLNCFVAFTTGTPGDDTVGDGILAEFPSVIGATECAVEIQTFMATAEYAPIGRLFVPGRTGCGS